MTTLSTVPQPLHYEDQISNKCDDWYKKQKAKFDSIYEANDQYLEMLLDRVQVTSLYRFTRKPSEHAPAIFFNFIFRLPNEWISLSSYRSQSQKEIPFSDLPHSAKLHVSRTLLATNAAANHDNSLTHSGRKNRVRRSQQLPCPMPLPPKGLFWNVTLLMMLLLRLKLIFVIFLKNVFVLH